jgi:hypothetical protein
MGQVNRVDSFNAECDAAGRSAGLWAQWRARHLQKKGQRLGQSDTNADRDATATAPPMPPQAWPRLFPGL